MSRSLLSTHVVARNVLAVLLTACATAVPAEAMRQGGAAAPTAVERTALEAAFTRADTNGDGRLSREEAAHFPEIAARFDELDKNHDGFLSFDEFAIGAAAPPR